LRIPELGEPIRWEGRDDKGWQILLTPIALYSYEEGGPNSTNDHWEQQGADVRWNGDMQCTERDELQTPTPTAMSRGYFQPNVLD